MITMAAVLLASMLRIGPERAVSEPVRNVQPYPARIVAFAEGGEAALAVWREQFVLRAARIDRDGRSLDEVPLLLTNEADGASVARGTNGWLVTWSRSQGVVAKLVADDGRASEPIVLATSFGEPDVAFDGTRFLVAWLDDRKRLCTARVTPSGQLLDIATPADTGRQRVVGLFPADGGFDVVLMGADVVAIRLDERGQLVSTRMLATPGIDVANWVNTDYAATREPNGRIVVAWNDGPETHIQREMAAVAIVPDAPHGVDDFVTIAGTTYAILRDAENRVAVVNLDTGARHDLSTVASVTRAASFGDRWVLAASADDLTLTVLDASMVIVAPAHLLYTEPSLQFQPKVAQAGSTRLIVWIEQTGARATTMAKLGEGEPFFLGDGPVVVGNIVAIATDGRDFLVLTSNELHLCLRRVRSDGTVLPVGIDLPSPVLPRACLAWTGSEYVVGYVPLLQYGNHRFATQVFAQRVTSGGEPAGEAVAISPGSVLNGVACASTSTATLFAWDDTSWEVGGATISRSGTVSGAFRIGTGTDVSVAAHSGGFVAGWSDRPPARFVHYATVTEGGTTGPPQTIEADALAVASRRAGYLLLYGTNPLRARTLDSCGNPTGEDDVIATASQPAFAGDTLVYQRDLDLLPQHRWRVFLRQLDFLGRRHSVRQ